MDHNQKKPILSFDLDGTLMQPGFGDIVWLEGLPKIYALTHKIPFGKAKDQLLSAYKKIGNSRREWYDLSYWIQKLDLPVTPQKLLKNFSKYIQPYPEVPDIIKRLSKEHTLIVSSAAMKSFIFVELRSSQLYSYFSGFFSATTDTNTVKKDPFFYEMIAKRLYCEPHEIIHVGDNYEFDYISPTKAGLFAFYLDRTGEENGNNVVETLTKFEKKIQEYPFD
jgi:HAD superfamily hydrolase (TIGR01549 family)